MCVKSNTVFKTTHFRMYIKLHTFCKTAHFVQYHSSFFHVSVRKFYTWLNIFTQPAVVMVVTNMKYVLSLFTMTSMPVAIFWNVDVYCAGLTESTVTTLVFTRENGIWQNAVICVSFALWVKLWGVLQLPTFWDYHESWFEWILQNIFPP